MEYHGRRMDLLELKASQAQPQPSPETALKEVQDLAKRLDELEKQSSATDTSSLRAEVEGLLEKLKANADGVKDLESIREEMMNEAKKVVDRKFEESFGDLAGAVHDAANNDDDF